MSIALSTVDLADCKIGVAPSSSSSDLSSSSAGSMARRQPQQGASVLNSVKRSKYCLPFVQIKQKPSKTSGFAAEMNIPSTSKTTEIENTTTKENIMNGTVTSAKKQNAQHTVRSAGPLKPQPSQTKQLKARTYVLPLTSTNKEHVQANSVRGDIVIPTPTLSDLSVAIPAPLPGVMNQQLPPVNHDIEMQPLTSVTLQPSEFKCGLKEVGVVIPNIAVYHRCDALSPIGVVQRPQLDALKSLSKLDDSRMPSSKASNIARVTAPTSSNNCFGAGILTIDVPLMLHLSKENKRKASGQKAPPSTKAQRLSEQHVTASVSRSATQPSDTEVKFQEQHGSVSSTPIDVSQFHEVARSLNQDHQTTRKPPCSPFPSLSPDLSDIGRANVSDSDELKPRIGDRYQVSVLPQVLSEEEKKMDADRLHQKQIVFATDHVFEWSSKSLDLVPEFTFDHHFSPSPPSPLLSDSQLDSIEFSVLPSHEAIQREKNNRRMINKETSSNDRYKVHAILCKRLTAATHRTSQRKWLPAELLKKEDFEYLVQWDGYSITSDTWEPYDHIEDYYLGHHYDRRVPDFPMEEQFDQVNPKYKKAKAIAMAQRESREALKEAAAKSAKQLQALKTNETTHEKKSSRRASRSSTPVAVATASASSLYRESEPLRMIQREGKLRDTYADMEFTETHGSNKEADEDEPVFMLSKPSKTATTARPLTSAKSAASSPTAAPASNSSKSPAMHHRPAQTHIRSLLSPPAVELFANEPIVTSNHVHIIEIDTDEEEENEKKNEEKSKSTPFQTADPSKAIEVWTTTESLSQAEVENRPYQIGSKTQFVSALSYAEARDIQVNGQKPKFPHEVIVIDDD